MVTKKYLKTELDKKASSFKVESNTGITDNISGTLAIKR